MVMFGQVEDLPLQCFSGSDNGSTPKVDLKDCNVSYFLKKLLYFFYVKHRFGLRDAGFWARTFAR